MLTDWQARWAAQIPPQALAELRAILDPHALTPLTDAPAPSSARSEAAVASDVRIAASQAGAPLWRNNVGGAYDATGRLIRFGLGNESPALSKRWKSSDLIGILPVRVTPAHVGQTLGVFLAVETKRPGWKLTAGDKRGQAQAAFIQTVRGFGGVAGFASSVTDIYALIGVDNMGNKG